MIINKKVIRKQNNLYNKINKFFYVMFLILKNIFFIIYT